MTATAPGSGPGPIEVSHAASRTLVTIGGDVEMMTLPRIAATLGQLRFDAGQVVVLDLRQVTFLDSSGLGAVVALHRRVAQAGARLGVVSGPGTDHLFALTNLRQVLSLHATPDGAVEALRTRGAQPPRRHT